MIISEKPAKVAGVFTRNLAAAAPVQVCRERITSGSAQGVVVNSGCANACTGDEGLRDALEMAEAAALSAKVDPAKMLVCSTGLIGSRLPMDKVTRGIKAAAAALGHSDEDASKAIMTTDTRPKRLAFSHPSGWSIGGIAKGAGMIAPNMATMLAFITTDAVLGSDQLKGTLPDVVEETFNAISIDGDTSTNDTVLVFANGASSITAKADDFAEGLNMICSSLARLIVADGEGTTKILGVNIGGAASRNDARLAARAVAESTLVKTAVFGEDANWGRVMAALGNSGAEFDPRRVTVTIAGVKLYEEGRPAGEQALRQARAAMSEVEIQIDCHLQAGNSSAQMYSTDLSPEYVKLNAAYET